MVSEPANRVERGPETGLKRNFPLILTVRQHALLGHVARQRGLSMNAVLRNELAAFFADQEQCQRPAE